jgi:hypothetical protein
MGNVVKFPGPEPKEDLPEWLSAESIAADLRALDPSLSDEEIAEIVEGTLFD